MDRKIVTAGGFSEIDKAASTMGRDTDSLKSDHEDADTRIILHAKEASDTGYERLVICCKNTDVLVLLMLRHKAGQEGRGEILLENSFMR